MADSSIPLPSGLSQLPAGQATGVYFLWHCDEIVYVGQSKTITQRIYAHIHDGSKTFDGMSWVACEPKRLSALERRYIEQLLPRYNHCPFSERVRREKPWHPTPEGGGIARFLGVTDEHFRGCVSNLGDPEKHASRAPEFGAGAGMFSRLGRLPTLTC